MVLMSVDFPRPVCPAIQIIVSSVFTVSILGTREARRRPAQHSARLDVSHLLPLSHPHTFLDSIQMTERLQCRLTDENDIELETALQELVLDLLGDRVETDIGLGSNFFGHSEAIRAIQGGLS